MQDLETCKAQWAVFKHDLKGASRSELKLIKTKVDKLEVEQKENLKAFRKKMVAMEALDARVKTASRSDYLHVRNQRDKVLQRRRWTQVTIDFVFVKKK
jgi:hypothetical protein